MTLMALSGGPQKWVVPGAHLQLHMQPKNVPQKPKGDSSRLLWVPRVHCRGVADEIAQIQPLRQKPRLGRDVVKIRPDRLTSRVGWSEQTELCVYHYGFRNPGSEGVKKPDAIPAWRAHPAGCQPRCSFCHEQRVTTFCEHNTTFVITKWGVVVLLTASHVQKQLHEVVSVPSGSSKKKSICEL